MIGSCLPWAPSTAASCHWADADAVDDHGAGWRAITLAPWVGISRTCARPGLARALISIGSVLVLPILAVMGAVWIRRRAASRQQRHAEEERLRQQAEEAERERRIIAEMEADFQRP
jgi:signal transduction histidine kinase